MILKIFQYDNVSGKVELITDEILLVSEFSALLDNERNICKEDPKGKLKLRAFREFTYIWLAIDWQSIYSDYDEQDRHEAALKDAELTLEEFDDPTFRAACRKYQEIQNSNRIIRMLHAAQKSADDFIDYFNVIVDLGAVDGNGKPIFTAKDLIASLSNLHKVHEEIKTLEDLVKKELAESATIRGGAVEGFLPTF